MTLLQLSAQTNAPGKFRVWHNSEGMKIEARFLKMEGKTVVLSAKGRQYRYPINSLSVDDQIYLNELLAKMVEDAKKNVSPERIAARDSANLETIYEAMKLQDLELSKEVVTAGEKVELDYAFVNTSGQDLVVPLNSNYSRPYHLIGTGQAWIERMGSSDHIPAFSRNIARQGRRYAAGGAIIQAPESIAPGGKVARKKTVDTTGYPAGTYTIYIEYKKLRTDWILETKSAAFRVE
ncbi:MAG: hypothetical protein AAGH89_17580 [Verrucomicrobiota bacterium]